MTGLEFGILGFATYRITRMMTRDAIFESARQKVWKRYPPETSKLGYLLTCEWCLSVWVGSLVLLCSIITPATKVVATALALSATAGLLAAYEDK